MVGPETIKFILKKSNMLSKSKPIILATTPTHSGKAEEMLEGTGCAPVYEAFELCLADNERSFAKCKNAMMEFRKCMDAWGLKKDQESKVRIANGEKTKETW